MINVNFKYRIKSKIVFEGQEYDTTEYLKIMIIDNDYLFNSHPTYSFSYSLPGEYLNFFDYTSNIFLEVEEMKDDVLNNVYNYTFRILKKPHTQNTKLSYADDSENQNASMPLYSYDIECVSLTEYNVFNIIYNIISRDTTIETVLHHIGKKAILDKNNSIDKMLLETPDNKKTLKTVIIPPLNIKEAITLLDKSLCIYHHDVRVFVFNDSIYVFDPIRFDKEKKVKMLNPQLSFKDVSLLEDVISFKVVSPSELESNKEFSSGYFTAPDGSNKTFHLLEEPRIHNNNKTIELETGSKIHVLGYDDNFLLRNKNRYEINDKITDKTKILWNTCDNSIKETNLIESNYFSEEYNIPIANFSISDFHPMVTIKYSYSENKESEIKTRFLNLKNTKMVLYNDKGSDEFTICGEITAVSGNKLNTITN